MLTIAFPVEPDVENAESVFASVDPHTLQTLDRCADEANLPRSWLIGRILEEWAGNRADSTSDTVDLNPQQQAA